MEVKPIPHSPTKKWFLDWPLDGGHFEREMLLGFDLSKRSSSCAGDLLQNCDLPPPLKLFSPVEQGDKKAVISTTITQDKPTPIPAAVISNVDPWEGQLGFDHGDENPSLLRALRLSQTRAREAEKKAAQESSRNQEMIWLLLEDSLRLSAYRRWVKLLEAEISMVQKKKRLRMEEEEVGDEGPVPTAAAWCFTVALCLGIAGVGFAVGRCMF